MVGSPVVASWIKERDIYTCIYAGTSRMPPHVLASGTID